MARRQCGARQAYVQEDVEDLAHAKKVASVEIYTEGC